MIVDTDWYQEWKIKTSLFKIIQNLKFFILDINLRQQLFWEWEYFKEINVINILFVGPVIFETKQWFLTLKLTWRSI